MVKAIVFALRFILFFACEYLFFTLAPWATCRPLSDLARESVPHAEIPSYAQCYYVNHGEVVFEGHPPLAEDPMQFALYAGLFITLLALFVWSGRWSKRNLYQLSGAGSVGPAVPQTATRRLGARLLIGATLMGSPLLLMAAAPFLKEGVGILIFAAIAGLATAKTGLPHRKQTR